MGLYSLVNIIIKQLLLPSIYLSNIIANVIYFENSIEWYNDGNGHPLKIYTLDIAGFCEYSTKVRSK